MIALSSVISPEVYWLTSWIIWDYDNSNPDAPEWKFYKPSRASEYAVANITDGIGFWILANSSFDLNDDWHYAD